MSTSTPCRDGTGELSVSTAVFFAKAELRGLCLSGVTALPLRFFFVDSDMATEWTDAGLCML
jgi:hypothetical protein